MKKPVKTYDAMYPTDDTKQTDMTEYYMCEWTDCWAR